MNYLELKMSDDNKTEKTFKCIEELFELFDLDLDKVKLMGFKEHIQKAEEVIDKHHTELIEQIRNDPDSTFSEEDIAFASKFKKTVELQRAISNYLIFIMKQNIRQIDEAEEKLKKSLGQEIEIMSELQSKGLH